MKEDAVYEEFTFSQGRVGHAHVTGASGNRALISDWTGTVTAMDVCTGERLASVHVGLMIGDVGVTLNSLAVDPKEQRLCAAATRAAFTAVWNLDFKSEIARLNTASGAPVNTIAWSPDSSRLAVGTGYYPLDGSCKLGRIEMWEFAAGSWSFCESAVMPGVCVAGLAWSPDGARLLASVGAHNQRDSHLVWLDAETLRVEQAHMFSFGTRSVSDIICISDNGDDALVTFSKCLMRVSMDSDPVVWSWEWDAPHSIAFDRSGETIFLDNGLMLDACSWSAQRKDADDDGQRRISPFLQDCTSVSVHRNGHLLGVNKLGKLGVWPRIIKSTSVAENAETPRNR
jgi:WD40 repeat protein